MGRFLSPGTIVPDLRRPQNLNRYTYARNNPFGYTDPTGHEGEPAGGGWGWSWGDWYINPLFGPPIMPPATMTPGLLLPLGDLGAQMQGAAVQNLISLDPYTLMHGTSAMMMGEFAGQLSIPKYHEAYLADQAAWSVVDRIMAPISAAYDAVIGALFADTGLGALRSVAGVESLVTNTAQLPDKLYHYGFEGSKSSILKNGLVQFEPGNPIYLTPSGELSALQAQIDLALQPNLGLRSVVYEIDVRTAQQLGVNFPAPTIVPRHYNMPGGGLEVPVYQSIPREAITGWRTLP